MLVSIIDQEIEKRKRLRNSILEIILRRCDVGPGLRIQRAPLYYYIWRKLGLHGSVGRRFASLCRDILSDAGFPLSAIRGHKCVKGLFWKNENPKQWRSAPNAEDLPIHKTQYTYEIKNDTMSKL